MEIYRITGIKGHAQFLVPERDRLEIVTLDPKIQAQRLEYCEYFEGFGHSFLVRQRVRDWMLDSCLFSGQFSTVECVEDGQPVQLFSYKAPEFNVLDEEKSDLVIVGGNKILTIKEFVPKSDCPLLEPVFRIPQLLTSQFVTSDFVRLCEKFSIRGINFVKLG